jgi:hypothetical protein
MELIFVALLFPVAWFLQNCIHEGSHLLVGWLVEGRVPAKFIPWPTKRHGKLYFAYYENGHATKDGSPKYRFAAPLAAAWLVMSISISFLALTSNPLFMPFFVCASIDYCVWCYGYLLNRPGTDGKAFLNTVGKRKDM